LVFAKRKLQRIENKEKEKNRRQIMNKKINEMKSKDIEPPHIVVKSKAGIGKRSEKSVLIYARD